MHTSRTTSKMVFVGWDGVDWDVITPLLDAGSLPNLERLVERGVMGDLIAPSPRLCSTLWNSLLTGRPPEIHGILTADEPDLMTGGRKPVSSACREVQSLWEILSRAGKRVHAVNWPASHPAEPIEGVCVSELYPRIAGAIDEPWPVPIGAIHPPKYEEILAGYRVHPAELDGPTLLHFVPGAAQVDQQADHHLEILATILAESSSVHAAATWLVEHRPSDVLAVRYDAIERTSRFFMQYHPPRLDHVSQRDFDLYRHVVASMYQFLDLLLGRLIELSGPDTTFVLVSDHGFHSGSLRPTRPTCVAEDWHRSSGIFVASGPGLKRDERIRNVGVLDVVPTLLTLLDLPVGRDMEGQALIEAFQTPARPTTRPSWEPEADQIEERVPTFDGAPSDELLAAFAALEAECVIDESIPGAPESANERRHAQAREFNRARAFLETGRPAEAVSILERLNRDSPSETHFALHLAQCRLMLGQVEECRRLVTRSLDRPEDRPVADYFLGRAAMLEGDLDEATASLRRAERGDSRQSELHRQIGEAYLSMRRPADAERAFERALAVDAGGLGACLGLARACLEQEKPREAVEAARAAIALRHDDPTARYLLGVGLEMLGLIEPAIGCYELCTTLHPLIPNARRRLVALRRGRSRGEARPRKTVERKGGS